LEVATEVPSSASESMPEAFGGRRVIRGTLQVQQNCASLHSLGAGQDSALLIVLLSEYAPIWVALSGRACCL
jgi:hypothetical protein